MANIVFPNNQGVWIGPYSATPGATISSSSLNVTTINAVGESCALIGRVILEGDSGTKTISAAGGGAIYIDSFTASTFANAGTNLRVGIQDVDGVTGIEDGTFDVYADLVGGTDTVPTIQVVTFAMENGTKTINHGDIVAISVEMTARGGADSVAVGLYRTAAMSTSFPYSTADTGSGSSKTSGSAFKAAIRFDDGTLGWIFPNFPATHDLVSFSSATTPDERAILFTLPMTAVVASVSIAMGAVAEADDFDIVIYSDPLGTPTIIQTIPYNAAFAGGAGANGFIWVPLNVLFEKDTEYAISVLAGANAVSLYQVNFNTGNAQLRKATPLGERWRLGTRTNGSGAFSETDTIIPAIGMFVSEIQAGGGGAFGFS